MPRIVLASKSIYKKELLARLKVPFNVDSPLFIEEEHKSKLTLNNLSEFLSLKKAESLISKFPDKIIIGCDQVIYLDDKRIDKPNSFKNACKQLEILQGKTHLLITSYTIIYQSKIISKSVNAKLCLRSLNKEEIKNYITLDSPLDCAGSYKLESLGIALMNSIQTEDYTTIMGLPLISLSRDLRSLGLKIP